MQNLMLSIAGILYLIGMIVSGTFIFNFLFLPYSKREERKLIIFGIFSIVCIVLSFIILIKVFL